MLDILVYIALGFATLRLLEFIATVVNASLHIHAIPEAEYFLVDNRPLEFIPETSSLFQTFSNLGFTLLGFRKVAVTDAGFQGNSTQLHALFWNEEHKIWAESESLRNAQSQVVRGMSVLESRFADGYRVLNFSNASHFFIRDVAVTAIVDEGGDLQSQLESQIRAIEIHKELHGSPVQMSLEDKKANWPREEREAHESYVKRGLFRRLPDGRFKPTLWGSFVITCNIFAKLRKGIRKQRQNLSKAEQVGIPVEAQLSAYESWKAIEQKPVVWSTRKKFLLLLASAAAFAISMSVGGGGMTWAAVLVLVIFFHELGHIWAMRLTGHKDSRILFIPFLGALAVGSSGTQNTAWQKVFILLMGPIPGLILSMGLALYPEYLQHEFVRELWYSCILINYTNLLPIVPLDGGRVIVEAAAGMGVILPLAFQSLGFLLLASSSAFMDQSVGGLLIIGLALVFFLSLRGEFYRGKLLNEYRKKKFETRQEAHLWLLDRAKQPYFSRLSATERFQLLQRVEQEAKVKLPRWYSRIGILFLYLLCLVIIPVALFGASYVGSSRLITQVVEATQLGPSEELEKSTRLLDAHLHESGFLSHKMRSEGLRVLREAYLVLGDISSASKLSSELEARNFKPMSRNQLARYRARGRTEQGRRTYRYPELQAEKKLKD